MKPGFIISTNMAGTVAPPEIILVSNYEADNEVVNWPATGRAGRTRSDIGLWKIKYKY
ncbi:hypothetical protein [uncultured Flavobacterium sp.]|uniref:hypothetical protein n=1 Tax=uncultured Flavobacterium sp. TaxID=165435 RepID=UPI0025FEF1DD|nr:hypothetical protein [uncultured Flavobacterium sp.]